MSPLERRRAASRERAAATAMRARGRRRQLVRIIAPDLACASCGVVLDEDQLEVDHVAGRDYEVESLSITQRVDRYWDEYNRGVELRALCRPCNAGDGGGRRYGGQRRARRYGS